MSKDSERQAWTKFVEARGHEKKTKRPTGDSFTRDHLALAESRRGCAR
jgi:hypothetical protein